MKKTLLSPLAFIGLGLALQSYAQDSLQTTLLMRDSLPNQTPQETPDWQSIEQKKISENQEPIQDPVLKPNNLNASPTQETSNQSQEQLNNQALEIIDPAHFNVIGDLRDSCLQKVFLLYSGPQQNLNNAKKRIAFFYQRLTDRGIDTLEKVNELAANLATIEQEELRLLQLSSVSNIEEVRKHFNTKRTTYIQAFLQHGNDYATQHFSSQFIDKCIRKQLLNGKALHALLPIVGLQDFIAHHATLACDIIAYKNAQARFTEHFANPLHADNFRYLDPLIKKEGPSAINECFYKSMHLLNEIHDALHATHEIKT